MANRGDVLVLQNERAKLVFVSETVRTCRSRTQADRLSPSQWPTDEPAPTKVLRVITIGRFSGRRLSMLSLLASLIMLPYLHICQHSQTKSDHLNSQIVRVVLSITAFVDKISVYCPVA